MLLLNKGALVALAVFNAALIRCDDYMMKKPAVQPTVCPCEYNFEPVCGSDGVTYTNECLLDCYSSNAMKRGKPPVTLCTDGITCSDCVCQPIDLPVCSADGDTYPNECELTCENYRRAQVKKPLVYLAYRTACLGPCCDCSSIASPVCGTDNVVYRNRCELNCASGNAKAQSLSPIEFKNFGACLDACQCPDVDAPVCGSDGREYGNLCQIACRNRKQTCSLSGPVMPAPKKNCKPCECTNVYNPVCGSDGEMQPRTFPNMCELNCEAERTDNPYMYVQGFGVCPTCFCTQDYQPVCGTDCVTYRNECELRCANQRQMRDRTSKSYSPISVFHQGACQVTDCDCSHCDPDYMPVCGSDDVTYWNYCWLQCNSKCSGRQSGEQITMKFKGACDV